VTVYSPGAAVVGVAVATLWSSPDRIRAVDAPALAPCPDVAAWVAGMDDRERVGDVVLSQLARGERVLVEEVLPSGWARVVALDQPAPRFDPRGYPGWLVAAHVSAAPPVASPAALSTPPGDAAWVVEQARGFLGVPYVWGGATAHGIDCSGLVRLVWGRAGVLLPRDSSDQADATRPVPAGTERAGDLYVFARPGRRIHHVGIVTAPGRMLHACYTRRVVVEEALPADRAATLVGARRVG
jgi:cell wall-associated NlpC family hydrolase